MLAVRLVRGYVGAPVQQAAPVFALTSAPDGGWPGELSSNAVWYNGKTYWGYITGTSYIYVRSLADGSTTPSAAGTLATAANWTSGGYPPDWHEAPGILLRSSDRKIVTAICHHVGPQMYVNISTNAEDATTFPVSATNITSSITGGSFTLAATYPSLHQLTSETNSPIYLFFRQHTDPDGPTGMTGELCYTKSTDQGATWSAITRVYRNTGKFSYWNTDDNGTDRIDFATTDGTGPGDAANVYHFYWQGGNFHKSDGTVISASLPLSPSDLTLVYSGATNPPRYVYDIAGNGGNPVVTFPVTTAGNEDYIYASWNGSAWSHHTIVSAGGSSSAFVEGGCALDEGDVTTVYLSKYVSGQWEVYRYQTPDGGATWSSTALTSSSANPNFYPICPRGHSSYLPVIWLAGTATNYTTFNLGTSGY